MSEELVQILGKLDSLSEKIESLERTVRGHDDEGNLGIIRKIDTEIERANRTHDRFEKRLAALESSVITFRAKVGGAAALGAAIGAGGTILASILGIFGGGS